MRDGWVEYKFKDVATAVKGRLPKTKNEDGIGIPYLTANFLRSSKPDYWIENIEGAVTAEDGDCLILWDGAGAGDLFSAHRGVVSSTMAVVTTQNSKILREFLTLFISSKADYIKETCRGTTVPHVSPDAIANMDLKIPPLPEQKRIVDLISSVDSYIEALQQQLESAKKSRNAVLLELLTVGGDDWVESTLGEIANWGSGGTPKADNPDFYDGEIPWCVIGDLTESEVLETEKRITNLGLSNSSAKVIDPGSVLLAMYGASIGRTGISAIPMATNQAIAFARCQSNLALPKYLLAYLQTQKTKFVEMGQGAAQPNISQTIIKAWPINLPPIPYQNHLVSTMEVFDATLFTLQSSINASKLLRSSLLSDLLSGEHAIPPSYDKVMGAA
jgi:type I restriction enzyme S subunit